MARRKKEDDPQEARILVMLLSRWIEDKGLTLADVTSLCKGAGAAVSKTVLANIYSGVGQPLRQTIDEVARAVGVPIAPLHMRARRHLEHVAELRGFPQRSSLPGVAIGSFPDGLMIRFAERALGQTVVDLFQVMAASEEFDSLAVDADLIGDTAARCSVLVRPWSYVRSLLKRGGESAEPFFWVNRREAEAMERDSPGFFYLPTWKVTIEPCFCILKKGGRKARSSELMLPRDRGQDAIAYLRTELGGHRILVESDTDMEANLKALLVACEIEYADAGVSESYLVDFPDRVVICATHSASSALSMLHAGHIQDDVLLVGGAPQIAAAHSGDARRVSVLATDQDIFGVDLLNERLEGRWREAVNVLATHERFFRGEEIELRGEVQLQLMAVFFDRVLIHLADARRQAKEGERATLVRWVKQEFERYGGAGLDIDDDQFIAYFLYGISLIRNETAKAEFVSIDEVDGGRRPRFPVAADRA